MGNVCGCILEAPEVQRIQYDMSPLKNKHIPIIWLIGPPGSGKNTQAEAIAEHLNMDVIKVGQLLRNESQKDSQRAKIIRDVFESSHKKVPDSLVVDLIKEEMLVRANDTAGFVINGFPKTSKQATLFVDEVGNVDLIIYLYSNTSDMIHRVQRKRGTHLKAENIRREIIYYVKSAKEGTAKFSDKIARIYTEPPPEEVFKKVESAIAMKVDLQALREPHSVNTTSKVTIKTDELGEEYIANTTVTVDLHSGDIPVDYTVENPDDYTGDHYDDQ